MTSVPRRIALLVASTAAFGALTALTAPVASADPPPNSSHSWQPPRCRPVHEGRDWRWDESRRRDHWDHRVWNRRTHRMEWQHLWREDRRCLPPRGQYRNGDGRDWNDSNRDRGNWDDRHDNRPY